MDVRDRAYKLRHDADMQLQRLRPEYDLADAWIGLDSLLKGAWGTENLTGHREVRDMRHARQRRVRERQDQGRVFRVQVPATRRRGSE
jgi:hypothetical protein